MKYHVSKTVVADSPELAAAIATAISPAAELLEGPGVTHYGTSVTEVGDDIEPTTSGRIGALIEYLGEEAALKALEGEAYGRAMNGQDV